MSGLVNGLQNRLQQFESATHLIGRIPKSIIKDFGILRFSLTHVRSLVRKLTRLVAMLRRLVRKLARLVAELAKLVAELAKLVAELAKLVRRRR